MRILLTGASSFTGVWFLSALRDAGHDVTVTMTQEGPDSYDEPKRRERVDAVGGLASDVLWATRFGDESFLRAVGGFDLLCHHGADVRDYKSRDFDVSRALASNTQGLRAALDAFADGGGRRVLLTGSVFEGGEGAGGQGLPHFSPYGLSKALTAEVFRYECGDRGLHLGKFVIPNPFGPMEEPRFTAYLMRNWFEGKTPQVNTPAYIRDNIHVDLLARCYAGFAESLGGEPGFSKCAPTGYVESQGTFTERLAREMRPRLGLECGVGFAHQTEFPEPRMRVNTDAADAPGWDEASAWDAFAEYYKAIVASTA